jgi:hypothetical protein
VRMAVTGGAAEKGEMCGGGGLLKAGWLSAGGAVDTRSSLN